MVSAPFIVVLDANVFFTGLKREWRAACGST